MAIEDILIELHEDEVDWDEVRERRVFNRIRADLAAPTGFSITLPRVALAAVVGISAFFLIGFLLSRFLSDSGDLAVPRPPAVAHLERTQDAEPSVMAIGDVGQVTLLSGARVEVWRQTDQVVKLQQTQGKAVYEIEHRSGRQVFVYANDVEIRVVGTVFTVTMNEDLVHVHVNKGIVRINDGSRLLDLHAGEAIGVAPRPRDSVPEGEAPPVDDSNLLADNDLVLEFDIDDIENADGQLIESGSGRPAQKNVAGQSDAESSSRRSTKRLFIEVDRARKKGSFARAAEILREIVARQDDQSSVVSALFILGKIERAQGRQVRAAKAFSKCYRLASGGPLSEDALAEEAAAWAGAGNKDNAQKAAQRYLERYPRGIHEERMNLILK